MLKVTETVLSCHYSIFIWFLISSLRRCAIKFLSQNKIILDKIGKYFVQEAITKHSR